VKSFRWCLIVAFALFMARPSNKRCTMCIDSQGPCALPTQLNEWSQPTDEKLKLGELYDLEQKSLEAQLGMDLDYSVKQATIPTLDSASPAR
jgi:hypothetical protein